VGKPFRLWLSIVFGISPARAVRRIDMMRARKLVSRLPMISLADFLVCFGLFRGTLAQTPSPSPYPSGPRRPPYQAAWWRAVSRSTRNDASSRLLLPGGPRGQPSTTITETGCASEGSPMMRGPFFCLSVYQPGTKCFCLDMRLSARTTQGVLVASRTGGISPRLAVCPETTKRSRCGSPRDSPPRNR